MNQRIYLLLFLLLSQFYAVYGQEQDSAKFRLITKASYHNGVLLPHRIAMQHMPKETTNGFEVNFEKSSSDTKDWERLYNSPTFGVSLLYTSTGNYDLLGNAFGANAYLLLPIFSTARFRLQTSWGWGLGWVGKKFDRLNNYKNNAIGSKLNLFASIKIKSEIYLNPTNAILLGAAFNHWSNSGIKRPNLGINIPTWSIGFLHKFYEPTTRPERLTKLEQKAYVPEQQNEFTVMPIVGFTSISIHDQNIYEAYALQFNYSRLWSAKYKINWSWDMFYNTAFKELMERNPLTQNQTAFQSGIMVSYEQTIGGFGIIAGWGTYLFDQTQRGDPFYHRFGTRFKLGKNIIINTTLHTHWAVSDHLEIGVGYQFRR